MYVLSRNKSYVNSNIKFLCRTILQQFHVIFLPFSRPAAQGGNSQNNVQGGKTGDETITVYAAPGTEHAHSPPTQVVRQLVVTDNKTTGQPVQGQLQLPQRPCPPGLPKPVPTTVSIL